MRNNTVSLSSPDAFGSRFSAATGSTSIVLPPSGLLDVNGLPLTRTANKMLAIASNEVVGEHCHALIAKSTLDNVAALTAYEEHLCCIAPGGANRYKAIVDQYTMGALQRMVRR